MPPHQPGGSTRAHDPGRAARPCGRARGSQRDLVLEPQPDRHDLDVPHTLCLRAEGDAGRAGSNRSQPRDVVGRSLGEDRDHALAMQLRLGVLECAAVLAPASPSTCRWIGMTPANASSGRTTMTFQSVAFARNRGSWPSASVTSTGSAKPLKWFATISVGSIGWRSRRPTLIVANHFNGFADPVLVTEALGHLPRFLSRRRRSGRSSSSDRCSWFVGVIPIHRQVDGEAGDKNRRAFEDAEAELHRKGMIGGFPEGTTHDIPRGRPSIRTGRGPHRPRREGTRCAGHPDRAGRALVRGQGRGRRSRVRRAVGEPPDLDHELWSILPAGAEASDEDRESVRALTGEITERLRGVTGLRHVPRRRCVQLGCGHRPPRRDAQAAGERAAGDSRAARGEAGQVRPRRASPPLTGSLGRYSLALDALGVTDEELAPRPTPIQPVQARPLARSRCLPGSCRSRSWGVLINAVPAVLVLLAGLAVKSPVTKGTMRILVAIVCSPAHLALRGELVRRRRRGHPRGARRIHLSPLTADRTRLRRAVRVLGRPARVRDGAALRALRDLDPRMGGGARPTRWWAATAV